MSEDAGKPKVNKKRVVAASTYFIVGLLLLPVIRYLFGAIFVLRMHPDSRPPDIAAY